jgi:hypothetical protein
MTVKGANRSPISRAAKDSTMPLAGIEALTGLVDSSVQMTSLSFNILVKTR